MVRRGWAVRCGGNQYVTSWQCVMVVLCRGWSPFIAFLRELGIAIVDKATVPLQLGTVTVTVAGAVTIPARILFLHPYLNFSLIQV